MTFDIETQAYRCFACKEVDWEELIEFFKELEYERIPSDSTPVYIDNWPDAEKKQVIDAKFIVKKDGFRICCVLTNSDSESDWKNIAKRIIKRDTGDCLVLSHNPSYKKWIFSSLSKKYSVAFSEIRHAPLEFVREEYTIQQGFLEFFQNIEAKEDDVTTTIARKISDAFDNLAIRIKDELTVNVYEALKILSEGIIDNKNNKLKLLQKTLDEIREPIFTLLYRIIFILYAEDRGIFPVDDPNDPNHTYYKKFSLKWIRKEWILKSADTELGEYEVQKRLWNLFKLIESGSDIFPEHKFSMRSYYGRIFDRTRNAKLESWKIPNSHLLKTLEFLTITKDNRGNDFFLDFAALDTSHLGSIYEHLLEYHLYVENNKIVDLPDTEKRKTTGSYYTPKYMVDYIVEKTIQPLIESIIEKYPNDKRIQTQKILELKILDPAMGSGHFLVGAVEYLATQSCKIEFGEFTEKDYIERKRDVVRSCIFGIDMNSLAVDLASLSLWLETLSSDKPLSFLQSHLKTGNSLIGSEIESIFGESDIHTKTTQTTLFESQADKNAFKKDIKNFVMFENLEDDTTSAVKVKIEKYSKMRSKGTIYKNLQFLLNCKTAEHFGLKLPILFLDYTTKIGENSLDYYSNKDFEKIDILSKREMFFHWELEFPLVFFDENAEKKIDGGFDAIIGNPPWERPIIEAKEFFSVRSPKIANTNTAIRKKLIKKLEKTNPALVNEYIEEKKNADQQIKYLKDSGKFQLSATGDINFYAIFLELARNNLRKNGRCGLIVPTGIITDLTYQKFSNELISSSSLAACHDFVNTRKIFKDVTSNMRFSLVFLRNSDKTESKFSISVLNESIDELLTDKNTYFLNKDEINLFNPNTKTCTMFPTKNDYEICKRVYEKNPILINENMGQESNTWNFEYWRMFDMSLDSHLFKKKEELVSAGFTLKKDNWFAKNEIKLVPLYESKFFKNYDHRYASFKDIPVENRFGVNAKTNESTNKQKEDVFYEIEPRYWLKFKDVDCKLNKKNVKDECFFAFRNTVRTFSDSRTTIGTIIPFSAVGHSAPVLLFRDADSTIRDKKMILFSCIFSSLVFDYMVRQKITGPNLSKYILIQTASPSPESFKSLKLTYNKITKTAEEWCIEQSSKVLPVTQKLVKPFKNFSNKPVKWDEDDRFEKICFVDAVIAHSYGLNSKDYEYILNQFSVLRRQEMVKYGKFLSLEKCLEFFDAVKVSKNR